mmetsp:Transcript_54571/g.84847  ORF Transcript_54571/g.84847 Transcript_54571/m.84847 type:complete len:204 (+) Transcript_54571:103-714(+)
MLILQMFFPPVPRGHGHFVSVGTLFFFVSVGPGAADPRPKDCAQPPYCRHWWLSGEHTADVIGVVFTGVCVAILVLLVVVAACLGVLVLGKYCFSAVDDLCCERGGGYKPVEQDEQDNEIEVGSSRRRRSWCNLVLACLFGMCLATTATGGGAFYWWRLSGSPPLAGLAYKTKPNHEGRISQHQHQGRQRKENAASRGQHKDH